MFMSENICTTVDLFWQGSYRGGEIVERKSEGDDET